MILELGKVFINNVYSGNIKAAINDKAGILWTDEKIKAAFNFGNGSEKDFKRYMNNNKKYAYFVEV